jgi:hypothetical protein
MPLNANEQALAEALLIEGIVTGARMAFAIKLRDPQKKILPQILVDMGLATKEQIRPLWQQAEAALKAAPAPVFTFSEGAMMGPYVLTEPRGSFLAGTHWRAKRPEGMALLRLVPPGTGLDPDRAQRLIDRANAGVDAPDATILRVDDAGDEFNWLYVGSLNFDGRSLAARLMKSPLLEAEALVVARTVARALKVAHGFGVVHGGLSTMAVVYGPDGPRLTDFGIGSVFFDGPTAGMPAGLRLGLLLYAAPELIQGSHETGLDARADLFALGGLLLDAVQGAATGGIKGSPNDPWFLAPPVSPGLQTILRRLLSLAPDGRYPSADALLQDLDRLAAGSLPGPLPPAGPPVRAERPQAARPLAIVTTEILAAGVPETDQPSSAPSPAPGEPIPQTLHDPEDAAPAAPTEETGEPELAGGDDDDDEESAEPETEGEPAADGGEEPSEEEPSGEGEDEPGFEGAEEGDKEAEAESEEAEDGEKAEEKPEATGRKRLGGLGGRRSSSQRLVAGRRPSQRLGRASTRVESAKPGKGGGIVPFVVSVVVVVGGVLGARAATAPDPAMRARIELARAHFQMARADHDYNKAQQSIAAALESAGGDAAIAADAHGLEVDLRERRLSRYLEARRNNRWAEAAPSLVEDTELECLHAFDMAKRDGQGDAKIWERIGLECLKSGFAREGAEALATAAQKDSTCAKAKELGARAAELGAFLPAGTYPATTLKKPLYVGAHAVTRDEYARWLDESTRSGSPHAKCSPKEPQGKSHAPAGWDPAVALSVHDRRPATGVDYWDAFACARGLGGRLPTPAELMAAATGPSPRSHPWGDHAFHPALANAASVFEGQLLPAGSIFAGASPSGAFDMLGNAEEWCAPASDDAAQAPVFGGDASTPAEKLSLKEEPRQVPLEERTPLRGFRVVMDLD